MKKLLLVGLLASGLFANQCEFWMDRVLNSSKMMTLSLQDGAIDSFLFQYDMYMEYSRYALSYCTDKETTDVLNKSRNTIREIQEKLR